MMNPFSTGYRFILGYIETRRFVSLKEAIYQLRKEGKIEEEKKLILDDRNGTGDTLASAIATHLAKGDDLATAVERAEAYMSYFLAGPRYYISANL